MRQAETWPNIGLIPKPRSGAREPGPGAKAPEARGPGPRQGAPGARAPGLGPVPMLGAQGPAPGPGARPAAGHAAGYCMQCLMAEIYIFKPSSPQQRLMMSV